MSIKVMSWVWEHADCKGGDLLVLLAMADIGDDHGGKIFPSVATLAEKVRLTDRAVQKILRRLEERGLIEVEAEANQHNPRSYKVLVGKSGVKKVRPSDDKSEVNKVHPCETPGVNSETDRGELSCTPGVNPSSPKPLDNREDNRPPPIGVPPPSKIRMRMRTQRSPVPSRPGTNSPVASALPKSSA